MAALRRSSTENDRLNLAGAVDNEIESGVPNATTLLRFADAVVGRYADLPERREALRTELGAAAVVDAVGVIANYQRMVRIADGCGIPLDAPTVEASADFRDELGVYAYASAANTPS